MSRIYTLHATLMESIYQQSNTSLEAKVKSLCCPMRGSWLSVVQCWTERPLKLKRLLRTRLRDNPHNLSERYLRHDNPASNSWVSGIKISLLQNEVMPGLMTPRKIKDSKNTVILILFIHVEFFFHWFWNFCGIYWGNRNKPAFVKHARCFTILCFNLGYVSYIFRKHVNNIAPSFCCRETEATCTNTKQKSFT